MALCSCSESLSWSFAAVSVACRLRCCRCCWLQLEYAAHVFALVLSERPVVDALEVCNAQDVQDFISRCGQFEASEFNAKLATERRNDVIVAAADGVRHDVCCVQ